MASTIMTPGLKVEVDKSKVEDTLSISLSS